MRPVTAVKSDTDFGEIPMKFKNSSNRPKPRSAVYWQRFKRSSKSRNPAQPLPKSNQQEHGKRNEQVLYTERESLPPLADEDRYISEQVGQTDDYDTTKKPIDRDAKRQTNQEECEFQCIPHCTIRRLA